MRLASGQIDIWIAHLDLPQEQLTNLLQTLSPDEMARQQRYLFERDRLRFAAARGQLRYLLSQYLDCSPAKISFSYGQRGKPLLSGNYPLYFNLSHSNELAVYALSQTTEVGVDIEYLRPLNHQRQIAQRFFAPAEYTALSELAEELQTLAFFNCWTRKEAFIKASGKGLSYPLDSFEVSLRPGEPARLLSIAGDKDLAEEWTLRSFSPAGGYVAALATHGVVEEIIFQNLGADFQIIAEI
ncbi:MAG TPA: 4'-phosphopantetheinyl transferase superfamily protein [Chloroflexia bacterium]|nr:4'-phosphopantetheinyl transferase superfamily protein [Chloroflexia bacterium]